MVQEPQEEKKEFLKRGEIKTMAKDIARLREIESQKEREKISSIDTGGKEKLTVASQEKPKGEEKTEEVKKEISIGLMPKPPLLKASPRKKYLIRGVIIFIVVLILGLSILYFSSKRSFQVETPIENPPVQEVPPETIPEKPEIIIPASFIQIGGTTIKEILKTEDIPEAFNQALRETIPLD
jgi:hypothetical protein